MGALSFGDMLAGNLRAARARAALSQEDVAGRMRRLGHSGWRYQTVGQAEKGKRRVLAEEVMALAWVLETSIAALLCPVTEDRMALPSGHEIAAESVASSACGVNDRPVRWKGCALDQPTEGRTGSGDGALDSDPST